MTRLGALLLLLVVAAGIYLAAKFARPYWTYLSLQDPAQEAVLAAVKPDGEAKARAALIEQARAAGLELAEDQIEFSREGPALTIRVSWESLVDLPGSRRLLQFRIEKSAPVP